MIESREKWNILFKDLKFLIKKPEQNFAGIQELFLLLHEFTHESKKNGFPMTLEDELWKQNGDVTFFNEKKMYSVAWHLWHSARIEDITCSHFICRDNEIIDKLEFKKKMNVPFRNTGNSMDFHEMETFNKNINIEELRNYRRNVAEMTQRAIKKLTIKKLKSQVAEEWLSKILETGSVTIEDKWLLDYWGKKDVSGIIMMPLSRHLLVHLNSAMRLL